MKLTTILLQSCRRITRHRKIAQASGIPEAADEQAPANLFDCRRFVANPDWAPRLADHDAISHYLINLNFLV